MAAAPWPGAISHVSFLLQRKIPEMHFNSCSRTFAPALTNMAAQLLHDGIGTGKP